MKLTKLKEKRNRERLAYKIDRDGIRTPEVLNRWLSKCNCGGIRKGFYISAIPHGQKDELDEHGANQEMCYRCFDRK